MFVIAGPGYGCLTNSIEEVGLLRGIYPSARVMNIKNEDEAHRILQSYKSMTPKYIGKIKPKDTELMIDYYVDMKTVYASINTVNFGKLAIPKNLSSFRGGVITAVENLQHIINVVMKYREIDFSTISSHCRVINDILDLVGPYFDSLVVVKSDSIQLALTTAVTIKSHRLKSERMRFNDRANKVRLIVQKE